MYHLVFGGSKAEVVPILMTITKEANGKNIRVHEASRVLSSIKDLYGHQGPDTVVHFVGTCYNRKDYQVVREAVNSRMLSWVNHNLPRGTIVAPSIDLYLRKKRP